MTKHLGIRIEPTALHYTITEIDAEGKVVAIDAAQILKIPKSQQEGVALAHVRTHVSSIINEFGVTTVGVKASENNARSVNVPRIHMEGVAIEAAHSSNASASPETLVTMAAALSLRRNQMKEIVAGNVDHLAVGEKWQSLSDKHREALLASYVSNMRGY